MDTHFAAALDIYSIANTYPREGRVLAHITQRTAVQYAVSGRGTQDLRVFMAFAYALAYIDTATYDALITRVPSTVSAHDAPAYP